MKYADLVSGKGMYANKIGMIVSEKYGNVWFRTSSLDPIADGYDVYFDGTIQFCCQNWLVQIK